MACRGRLSGRGNSDSGGIGVTDRNIQKLLDKNDMLTRANDMQLQLIEQLRRRLASRERAVEALEAREAVRGAKTARPALSGQHSKREGHLYE